MILRALHPGIFEQPVQKIFFNTLLNGFAPIPINRPQPEALFFSP
jgi:hypothetical protein